MNNGQQFHSLHKINLNLHQNSNKLKSLNGRSKERNQSNKLDSNKEKRGVKKMNNSIGNIINNNNKIDKNISQDMSLQKLNQHYSELFKRISEDKRELGHLNKIYNSHVLQTEGSYKNSVDKNNRKSKNNISNNNIDVKKKKNHNININIYNINKKDNNTSINNDSQLKHYYKKSKELNAISLVDSNKVERCLKPKPIEKNNIKKTFNKSKRNNNIIDNMNEYIKVNPNTNSSINRKKIVKMINNTIDNYFSDNNNIEGKTLKAKKFDNNKTVNISNKSKHKKINNSQNHNVFHYENNTHKAFDENKEKKIKLIKINDLNNNHFHKNKSTSTIYYSPENYYTNITNLKNESGDINIQRNEKNNKNLLSSLTAKGNNKKILFTIKDISYYDRPNNKEDQNAKKNEKSNTFNRQSMKYAQRNTISFINQEDINNNDNNRTFTLNELYNNPNASNNILTQRRDNYYKSVLTSNIETPKAYFYQMTDENFLDNPKKRNILNKCKITINQSRQMFGRKEKQEAKEELDTVNEKINNIKDYTYYDYNTEKLNHNIYYNKKKILCNISVPKKFTISDLIRNNLKENPSGASSSKSYMDYNLANLSSIKKENEVNTLHNKNIVSSSRKKLSNSFNKEINNINNLVHYTQTTQSRNAFQTLINDNNIYYRKKNCSLLISKEKNRMNRENYGRNSMKYIKFINRYEPSKPYLNTEFIGKNSGNDDYYFIKTEHNLSKDKRLYTKPLRINSKSKNKNIENRESSKNKVYKKKISHNSIISNSNDIYKINNSVETINQEKINSINALNSINNFNKANYSRKPIKIKKIPLNSLNEVVISPTNDINVKKDKNVDYKQIGRIVKKNIFNNEIFNENNKLNKSEQFSNASNYNIIEKNYFNCFYKKLYNYYTKMPIKKVCIIEKVKTIKRAKNDNNDKYEIDFDYSQILKCKTERGRFKNLEFNGKNIITKNITKENKKSNGSLPNLESLKEIYEPNTVNINTNSANDTFKNKTTVLNSDKKKRKINLKTNNLLDNTNNNNNNYENNKVNTVNYNNEKNPIHCNKMNVTSKKPNNPDKKFINKDEDELSKQVKICLATNKLNNIFLTKNENEEVGIKRSITEEKFTLGCSKLNDIFHKKSLLSLCNLQKKKVKNINNAKNKNKIIDKNKGNIENDDRIMINQKYKTYTTKEREKKVLENDLKNITRMSKDNKNQIIRKTFVNLLNILTLKNIDLISKKLVDEILYIDYYINQKDIENQYKENETIFIEEIFNKVSNEKEKCILSLYSKLINSINSILRNEFVNNMNYNEECNIISIIITEFYKRIINEDFNNNKSLLNEKEFEIISDKFIVFINFMSELILLKLIKEKENLDIIERLFNEYNKNTHKIKYLYLKGIILLLNTLLSNIYKSKITEEYLNNLEIHVDILKKIIKDKNISYNLKISITQIIEKFYEYKESKTKTKEIEKGKYSVGCSIVNTEEKEFGRLSSQKKGYSGDFSTVNASKIKNINESCNDENGGSTNNLIYNSNSDINFGEISFKADNNKYSDKKKKNKMNYLKEKNNINCESNNKNKYNKTEYNSNKKEEIHSFHSSSKKEDFNTFHNTPKKQEFHTFHNSIKKGDNNTPLKDSNKEDNNTLKKNPKKEEMITFQKSNKKKDNEKNNDKKKHDNNISAFSSFGIDNNDTNKINHSINVNNGSNHNNRKKKSKSKKHSKSQEKKMKKKEDKGNKLIINENDTNLYNTIKEDFEKYLEFLLNKGIKTKNDLYIDINYSYNWNTMDELITVKKMKLEDVIKSIIEICKNKNDINKSDIFKISEYMKTLIEYYSNDLSDNQIEIFHLNMIELYMDINNIVGNDSHSEIMYEIMGNLLFTLLKNKLYYIKDLNNYIDKSKEAQINMAKVVKFAIIASGNHSKQYFNDFKYTKLFNGNDLFTNYISNELTDFFKK